MIDKEYFPSFCVFVKVPFQLPKGWQFILSTEGQTFIIHLFIHLKQELMKEILLFGRALNTNNVSPITVNELAISKGYVVDPECCNQRVVDFLVVIGTLRRYRHSFKSKAWCTRACRHTSSRANCVKIS